MKHRPTAQSHPRARARSRTLAGLSALLLVALTASCASMARTMSAKHHAQHAATATDSPAPLADVATSAGSPSSAAKPAATTTSATPKPAPSTVATSSGTAQATAAASATTTSAGTAAASGSTGVEPAVAADPVATGVRPYNMAGASALASSGKLAFAHYFPPFPVSYDNKDPRSDYYTQNMLSPQGESGKHAAYGGLLRDRPVGRAPLSGDYQMADLETEVQQARSAGLDGFSVDILSLQGDNWNRTVKLLQAAHAVDPAFKIMLVPDMTTLGNVSPDVIASSMAQLASYPAAFHLGDGRLVVSPFDAEVKSVGWWSSWLNTMKSTHGIDVAFVPTFLYMPSHAKAFAPISYGFSDWGSSNPTSNQNAETYGAQAHSLGKLWMAPVRVQDVRPNQGVFEEADNTETLRHAWSDAMAGNAEWVNIPTWNDYSEGTPIAPSAEHGWSYLDISSYYLARWKTGAYPAIVRDGLYLSNRTQTVAATPSYHESKLMKLRSGTTPARDDVEALAFLTAPATVNVRVGSKTYSWDAPAGVSAKTFPLGTGQVSGSVNRAGHETTQVTSPYDVVATPKVQDLQYHAVGSLRP